VREECLAGALARREPWGVWGGELFANGKVLAQKRRRGRPPKVARPEPVLEDLVPVYVAREPVARSA
jgi:WhiB family redox-sensing transcriptional regulator